MYQIKKDAIFDIIIVLNKKFYFTFIKAAKTYNIALYIIYQKLLKIDLKSLQTLLNHILNL